MYFTFSCPQCDKKLKVREELTGRGCRCPYCKASITVPVQAPEEDAARQGFPPVGDLPSDSLASSRLRTRKKSVATRQASGKVDRTDINMLQSGLLGLVISAAFLAALFPLKQFYFGELFSRFTVDRNQWYVGGTVVAASQDTLQHSSRHFDMFAAVQFIEPTTSRAQSYCVARLFITK